MSPFDNARFEALTKGLEVSVVALSVLERTRRIDAEYFSHSYRTAEQTVAALATEPLTMVATVSDGNHFTISDAYTDSGVPYFRGQDVSGTFFADPMRAVPITSEAFNRSYMRRSHLRRGDVLLSIVGTIGATALVDFDSAATCSCKLAILRPRSVTPGYLATYLSTSFGQRRIKQLTRGAVQRGLILEDADQIRLPRFSCLEKEIDCLVDCARGQLDASKTAMVGAEVALLDMLGLRGWSPPEPLTYTRSASDVTVTKRMDAQFHAPAEASLRAELANRFPLSTLGELGLVTNGRTVEYDEAGSIPIIRSGDVGKNYAVNELLRAKALEPVFHVRKGDVLISSIGFGSIGRVEAITSNLPAGTVSEVTVVRQTTLDAHYLTAFLRSPAGQLQLNRLITGATGQLHLYPRDVRDVFVPVLSQEAQDAARTSAEQAERSLHQSRQLLNAAKRAVEIAVEESEAAALTFISDALAINEAQPRIGG